MWRGFRIFALGLKCGFLYLELLITILLYGDILNLNLLGRGRWETAPFFCVMKHTTGACGYRGDGVVLRECLIFKYQIQ